MLIKRGDKFYGIAHAYYHYLVEVEEVLGSRVLYCRRIVRVHSCARGWTEFFANGCQKDTILSHYTPGILDLRLGLFEWPHEIPKPEKK